MVKRISLLVLAPLLLVLLACGDAPTEIILTIDADPVVEAMIDHLELIADDGRNEPRLAETEVEPGAFPKSIGLLEQTEAAGPLMIRVVGRLDGVRRIETVARISFEEATSLERTIYLYEDCIGVFGCSGETTCGRAGVCVPIDAR